MINQIKKLNPFIKSISHSSNQFKNQFHSSIPSSQLTSTSTSIPNQISIKNHISNQPQSQSQSLIKFKPFINKPAPERIPNPHHSIETVEKFLSSLKRPNLLDLKSKFDSWNQFFESNGTLLKSKSINPKERRYLLWAMELFRHGKDPKEFAVKLKKKKVIRGWGPRVQNGKRLRGKPGGRITL
ncbi:uncharacterized protein MELLADRAFT_110614 [Melampsora larici-populina 98AG31]|uniref:Small ribosomal subunit protein mS41 n=1 Tax=Melampsora larici-populina (strain 98AG31 / pathotype 3-4-7) TaxID=747676 RepID=F4S0D8_MELLP|nr:uncharacterized protein MELLADRAFT_110614 [Melampsora larici-populina 98AG31]EGG01958.1 hypothetical protein MELLADRAFT_110614 [Melampsora larici-populina 98AG31]